LVLHGNIDQSFDLAKLTIAAGASYVARGTVYNARQSSSLIKKALDKKGFSVVEIISDCPVSYGGRYVEMDKRYKCFQKSMERAFS